MYSDNIIIETGTHRMHSGLLFEAARNLAIRRHIDGHEGYANRGFSMSLRLISSLSRAKMWFRLVRSTHSASSTRIFVVRKNQSGVILDPVTAAVSASEDIPPTQPFYQDGALGLCVKFQGKLEQRSDLLIWCVPE